MDEWIIKFQFQRCEGSCLDDLSGGIEMIGAMVGVYEVVITLSTVCGFGSIRFMAVAVLLMFWFCCCFYFAAVLLFRFCGCDEFL